MIEIRRSAVEKRDFADWSMLYERDFAGHDADLARLAANGRIDPDAERMIVNFIALGTGRAPLH